MKKDTCKICSNPLNGIMIFYPELCLKCVVDLDNTAKKKDKKNKKNGTFWRKNWDGFSD